MDIWSHVKAVTCVVVLDMFSIFIGEEIEEQVDEYATMKPSNISRPNKATPRLAMEHAAWTLIFASLAYKWECLLEKTWPTIPRNVQMNEPEKKNAHMSTSDQKQTGDMTPASTRNARKPKRRKNIILKCVIDCIVGPLLFNLINIVVLEMFYAGRDSEFVETPSNILWVMVDVFFESLFSLRVLTSIIKYTVMPVQYRITFDAATNLLWQIVFLSLTGTVYAWLNRKQLASEMMRESDIDLKEYLLEGLKLGEL